MYWCFSGVPTSVYNNQSTNSQKPLCPVSFPNVSNGTAEPVKRCFYYSEIPLTHEHDYNQKNNTSIGKDVEKLGPSCIAGRNVKRYNSFEKQSGSSSKGKTQSHHLTQQYPREMKTHIYTKTYTWKIATLLIIAKK